MVVLTVRLPDSYTRRMDVAQAVDRVVDTVGQERFDQACVWAWRTAAEAGRPGAPAWPDTLSDLPREITTLLFVDPPEGFVDVDDLTRQGVVFACYRRMPCLGLLEVLPAVRTEPVLASYWDQVRALLDEEDDRFAAPVAEHLRSGHFGAGGEVAADAWAEVTRGIGRSRHRLRRVLDASGPVPWSTKRDLFARLADDPVLRPLVVDAVAAARADPRRDLDELEVRRWGV